MKQYDLQKPAAWEKTQDSLGLGANAILGPTYGEVSSYVQYLTAEADEEQESTTSNKDGGGRDTLRGAGAGLGSVTLLAALALSEKHR